jgi:quercetin dioxygenase-like cupin family protein
MTTSDDACDNTEPAITASLLELISAAQQDGPIWSRSTADLNVNLVVLRAGHAIGAHVNREVDVLLVGLDGSATVTVNGQPMSLDAGGLLIVPKGANRAIDPNGDRVAYLTCHQRRAGLWPSTRT